jgi:hypothetical protein
MVADFQCSVLSETAGTGRRFNPIGLHRRVKTDLSGRKAGAIGSNLMHLARGL